MVQHVLQWERQERCSSRERVGDYGWKNALIIMNFLGGLIYNSSQLGKTHRAHFSTSMCYIESWGVNLPSMCLDHIIAHETYHLCLALPLNSAPKCFIKQRGTSRTQVHNWFFGLATEMFGIWGLVIYRWKRYITCPKTLKNCNCKTKKKNMQSLSDYILGCSKELQWENDCGFFSK